jgi:hypothetical protein
MRSFEVFISHRSTPAASELASALFQTLRRREVDAFLDTERLEAGAWFATEIQESIRRARIVVVFFERDVSSWVHFEAALAFFDRKLIPVAIDGAAVPSPYDRIHHEDSGEDGALDRIADQVERRLQYKVGLSATGRAIRWLNDIFAWGAWVMIAIGAAILIPFGEWGDGQRSVFLLALFTSLVLGGQFFLSLAFSRAVASPSFREREFGFGAVRKLLFVWLPFVILPATMGFLWILGPESGSHRAQPWSFLAFSSYCSSVFIFVVGYLVMRESRELDREGKEPERVGRRQFAANVLFILAFVFGAWALSLAVLQEVPSWIGRLGL